MSPGSMIMILSVRLCGWYGGRDMERENQRRSGENRRGITPSKRTRRAMKDLGCWKRNVDADKAVERFLPMVIET